MPLTLAYLIPIKIYEERFEYEEQNIFLTKSSEYTAQKKSDIIKLKHH